MKIIYILISSLLLCSIAAASMEELHPYTIRVIVWDADGNRESDVPVTFAYEGQSDMLYSAEDGTLSFSLLNFDDVHDGAHINVSCVYETKNAPVQYVINETIIDPDSGNTTIVRRPNGYTGVTFNEPSTDIAIAAWAMMGFIATAIGGGIYLLRRRKN